jgi:hypothetical protein
VGHDLVILILIRVENLLWLGPGKDASGSSPRAAVSRKCLSRAGVTMEYIGSFDCIVGRLADANFAQG